LIKQEKATLQLCISTLERSTEQLRKERDTALDESAIANAKVHNL